MAFLLYHTLTQEHRKNSWYKRYITNSLICNAANGCQYNILRKFLLVFDVLVLSVLETRNNSSYISPIWKLKHCTYKGNEIDIHIGKVQLFSSALLAILLVNCIAFPIMLTIISKWTVISDVEDGKVHMLCHFPI